MPADDESIPPMGAVALHAGAVVVDGTCPSDPWRERFPAWLAGGASACVVTVSEDNCRNTMATLGGIYRLIREHPQLRIATDVDAIRDAKRDGVLAVVLQFQGTEPIEFDENLVDAYWRLGVRVVQLTYNVRGLVGDGCEEPNDAGLSRFGRRIVAALNRTGIVVDVSHTGERTSLDAVAASTAPCVASHSNAAAVHPNPRNISDDLIRAIAAGGGIIGANGFPAFVSAASRPSLDEYIDHMAHVADLVGTEHVAIGLDYTPTNLPIEIYEQVIREGTWARETYPPPPWHYPTGLTDASMLPNLTERLLRRGFGESDVRGILGENWLRVFAQVWTR